MKSSLIPETPILVYPSLAATLGLEESVLLVSLANLVANLPHALRNEFAWYEINTHTLLEHLPFWEEHDIQRVLTNLREKGVVIIASAPIAQAPCLKFAFNEKAQSQYIKSNNQIERSSAPETAPKVDQMNSEFSSVHSHFLSKNHIAPNWQPDQETLTQLTQHNIPTQFAMEQVPEFVTFWRSRKEAHFSWGAKFVKHVIRLWRNHEVTMQRKSTETSMNTNWQPSDDAIEIMTEKAGIPLAFIEDAIPEFILYWQERGDQLSTWNSKFIQHVRIQWKKFHSSMESNTDPRPINANWHPSPDTYDVIRLANIDTTFAQQLVPEFVLYWMDTNQLHTSWNTRFLQHVKRQWANRHSIQTTTEHTQKRSTRDLSLEEQLTDRSWAG